MLNAMPGTSSWEDSFAGLYDPLVIIGEIFSLHSLISRRTDAEHVMLTTEHLAGVGVALISRYVELRGDRAEANRRH